MEEALENNNPEDNNNKAGGQKMVLSLIVGGVILGLIYLLFIARKNDDINLDSYSPTVTQSTTTPITNLPTTVQEVNVSGNEFAFNPSTITIKNGQLAQITFTNTGKFPHDFSIPDLDVKTKIIQPGESDSVQFTPNNTGSFQFDCTVTGHADKGMTGMLIVE